jgi:hypothetical protein
VHWLQRRVEQQVFLAAPLAAQLLLLEDVQAA